MLSELLAASTQPDGKIKNFRGVLRTVRTYLEDHHGDPAAMAEWLRAISGWVEARVLDSNLRQTWELAEKMYQLTPVSGEAEFVDIVTGQRVFTGQELDSMGWPEYYKPSMRGQITGMQDSTTNTNESDDMMHEKYDVDEVYLREGRKSDKRNRPGSTSMVTRSGFNGAGLHNARQAVREWALESRYIQEWMRQGVGDSMGQHEKLAKDILLYMHHRCPRVPVQPKGFNVRFLYRGLSGAEAASFERTGVNVDPGFMAFSTDSSVSRRFAKVGSGNFPVMRLDVGHIPRGTPWLWYDSDRTPVAASAFQHEVLMGPGTLTVSDSQTDVPLEQNMVPVRYEANLPLQQSILDSIKGARAYHRLP